jgi:hypothetical protein
MKAYLGLIIACSIVIAWLLFGFIFQFSESFFLVTSLTATIALEFFGSVIIVFEIAKKFQFSKASSQEIKREDDVLLQGAPFISAILFFYLNVLFSVTALKIALGLAIVSCTSIFYVARAIAKIKCNKKFRFYSMYSLIFLSTSFIYEIVLIAFPFLFPSFLTMSVLIDISVILVLAIFPIFSIVFATVYFPIRYDVTGKRLKQSLNIP